MVIEEKEYSGTDWKKSDEKEKESEKNKCGKVRNRGCVGKKNVETKFSVNFRRFVRVLDIYQWAIVMNRQKKILQNALNNFIYNDKLCWQMLIIPHSIKPHTKKKKLVEIRRN